MGGNNGHSVPTMSLFIEQTDEEIVDCVKNGDLRAFEILVQRYEKKIYKFLFRMVGHSSDSEDLTQEVFVQAFSALQRYQSRGYFSAWLFAIARNISKNFSQKKIREKSLLTSQELPENLPATNPAVPNESQDRLQSMLTPLPNEYRRVMILKYISDLTCEEIAQIENISESAVKQRLHRAREIIREL